MIFVRNVGGWWYDIDASGRMFRKVSGLMISLVKSKLITVFGNTDYLVH